MINKRSQSSGDSSLNIQTEVMNINSGLSISHVRELALEVFDANFHRLSGVAREVAEARAREFTDHFIAQLSKKAPDALESAKDPDFQYAIFHAQKSYVRAGDRQLGSILADILVDRAQKKERDLVQLCLNEAISVAPKLSRAHLDILACRFHLAYFQKEDITNVEELVAYINDNILTFSGSIAESEYDYDYLIYAGCTRKADNAYNASQLLRSKYPMFFVNGFSRGQMELLERENPKIANFIIPCFQDNTKFQARVMTQAQMNALAKDIGVPQTLVGKLIHTTVNGNMEEYECSNYLVSICPPLKEFFDKSGRGSFQRMELTGVGLAIAHAHSRLITGLNTDLSNWLN